MKQRPEDPKRFIEKTGTTRRSRTGDLLITKNSQATANLSKLEKDQKNKSNDIQATKDSFPGLQRIMAPVRDADRRQAWSQIKQEFSRFGDANGFEAPGEVRMAP